MRKFEKKIKTCVNCRHLEILEEGQIVDGLDNSSYISFRCNVFNYSGKEVFGFPLGNKPVVIEKETDSCPFWEEWIKPSDQKEEKSGSGKVENKLEPDKY